ncbi:MAG: hypothetical protein ACOVQT_11580 [Rubrivivax sp.]
MPSRPLLALVLGAAGACALAQSPPPAEPVVVTAGFATPRDARTLGELMRARALFEQLRALSPDGELSFRVLARLNGSQADRLGVQLVTAAGRVDIPLDDQSRFVLQPQWENLPPDTAVRSRVRDGGVVWRSDVRTPGLPENTRRLGDLRLQCKLDWGVPLGRTGLGVSRTSLVVAKNQCESEWTGAMNSQFADRPVLAIDLVHGTRRERLSYFHLHGAGDNAPTRLLSGLTDWAHQLKDHMYRLPLHDRSWPDDALVEFTFMDPAVRLNEERL